jgi:NAD(P)-dependent dehydrogenase (short-subunit alcohol dehydrogenase family)
MITFIKMTPDFLDEVIDTNNKEVLNCCYTVLEDMIAKKYAKIINIGSDVRMRAASAAAVRRYMLRQRGHHFFQQTNGKIGLKKSNKGQCDLSWSNRYYNDPSSAGCRMRVNLLLV